MHKRHGFTIVELLIVIVVIAILAAITIVGYNGIQIRAENTKTVAGVNQAVKLMRIYKEINGSYPSAGGNSYACIGSGYASQVCATATDGVTPSISEISSFSSALQSVGTLPQLSTKQLTLSTGAVVAGASYEPGSKMIRYHLAGAGSACDAGGTKYVYGDTVQCRIILD